MVKIILLICCLPTVFIMYFLLRNDMVSKKNIILGVTIPCEYTKSEEVVAVTRLYNKELTLCFWISLGTGLLSLLPMSDSICFTYIMVWTLAIIVVLSVPFVRGNKRLQTIKKEKEWVIPNAGTMKVDLGVMTKDYTPKNMWWCWIPVVASFAVVGWVAYRSWNALGGKTMIAGIASVGIIPLVMTIIMRSFNRQKPELISKDENYNAQATRVRRYYWNYCWLALSVLSAAYTLMLGLYMLDIAGSLLTFLLATSLYVFFTLGVAMWAEMKTRLVQQQLTAVAGDTLMNDEDCYWLWGMIYYNKNDKHTMVSQRTGMGSTINLATVGGKIWAAIGILGILSIPVCCAFLLYEDFSPTVIQIEGEMLSATHGSYDIDIPLQDIAKTEWWTQMPSSSKIEGYNSEKLLKGDFTVKGYGHCVLMVNPQIAGVIYIEDKEGHRYIMNLDTIEDTMTIYEHLQLEVSE